MSKQVFLNTRFLMYGVDSKPVSICSLQKGPYEFDKLRSKNADVVLGLKYESSISVDKLITHLDGINDIAATNSHQINAGMLQSVVYDLMSGKISQDAVVATINAEGDRVIQIKFKKGTFIDG